MADYTSAFTGLQIDAAIASTVDFQNPVAVTTTATLTIGKHHVCTGTTADYTVTLPAVSGNAGKLISVEMSAALTKLVTIDGNAAETIDGELTRIMWAKETAILLCNGTTWTKVAGKSIPMICNLAGRTLGTVTLTNGVYHQPNLNLAISDPAGLADLANDKVIVRRTGNYHVKASGGCAKLAGGDLGGRIFTLVIYYNNGVETPAPGGLGYGGAGYDGTDTYASHSGSSDLALSAGTSVYFKVRSNFGVNTVLYTGDEGEPTLVVMEVLTW